MGRKKKSEHVNEKDKILSNKKTKIQDMACKVCKRWVYDVAGDAISVTCALCVARDVGMPEELQPKAHRPKGWHFRAVFVDPDGTVYHKGEEQPDLKGTITPTEESSSKSSIKKKKPSKKADTKTMGDMIEDEFKKIIVSKNKKKKK